MKLWLATLILLTSVPAFGQFGWYNSEDYWHRLSLDNTPPASLTETDTAIVVVSNRIMQKDSLRFMAQKRDEHNLHYFICYTYNGQWHLYETHTLEAAINYMPDKNRDWVTYVEGMGKLFTSDLERGISLTGTYKVNTIMFDYPSISTTKKSLGNYYFAMHNAKIVYKDFVPVLAEIKSLREHNKMGTGHISLFFHSMGNNMIRETVRKNKLWLLNDDIWADNIILNAPCVPQLGHRKWLNKIQFARNIYVHYNPKDRTLGGAYLVSKLNQLGMKVKHPLSSKVCYINFHSLVNIEHSNFLNLPYHAPAMQEAIAHYNIILHGHSVHPENNNAYAHSAYKHIGWDILPKENGKLTRKN